jgi:hypothetical protein
MPALAPCHLRILPHKQTFCVLFSWRSVGARRTLARMGALIIVAGVDGKWNFLMDL